MPPKKFSVGFLLQFGLFLWKIRTVVAELTLVVITSTVSQVDRAFKSTGSALIQVVNQMQAVLVETDYLVVETVEKSLKLYS